MATATHSKNLKTPQSRLRNFLANWAAEAMVGIFLCFHFYYAYFKIKELFYDDFSKTDFQFYLNIIYYFVGYYYLFTFLVTIRSLFFHAVGYFWPGTDFKKRPYGEWVIITGASDGIGLAYAEEFAKFGYKILLVARNEKKLEKVALRLSKRYDTEVDYLVIDFSEQVEDYILDLRNKIYTIRRDGSSISESIAILINNVGILPYAYNSLAGDIEKKKKEKPNLKYPISMQEALNVNCVSQAVMTSELLNLMRFKFSFDRIGTSLKFCKLQSNA